MQKNWRIKDLLEWTTRYFFDRGMQESRLEAEVLLAHVLERNRVYLYANYEEPVNKAEREIYREYIKRRLTGEPLAYIIGRKEFMSLNFKVNPDVLIPRPDTEVLVETALKLAREENIKRICDVGTGSGAIAVSLAFYLPETEIYAIDLSPAALNIARENAALNGVTVIFREGDLLEPLDRNIEKLDLITANLPYITSSEIEKLEAGVKNWEPRMALLASGDGLDIYRRLLPQAIQLLKPGGYVLLEIDPRQADAAYNMMDGFSDVQIIKDEADRDRLIKARRNF